MRKTTQFTLDDLLMYIFLFICINTSKNWGDFLISRGEIFRFDKILLFGQANIYHIFVGLFFIIIFFKKFGPSENRNFWLDRNYLKNIFWLYFVPVNLLIYLSVYIKDINLKDLGVAPIVTFFTYLIFTYYTQDVFFQNKDKNQLNNILTTIEILIISRCWYSIIKYLLGFGSRNPLTGGVRLGAENDFADFFVLLFIIALTRLFFGKHKSKKFRILHLLAIISPLYVGIFSYRRYFSSEILIALSIILFFYYRFNRINFIKKIITVCFFAILIISSFLFIGENKLSNNYIVGRMLTSFSLLNYKFESQYGNVSGHIDEIKDGWYNIKNNWLLGITPFGQEKIRRFKTKEWQKGLYVHNAYLFIWLEYGLLGLVLFVFLYFKSIQLGYILFFKFDNNIGLILSTFMICQMIKNIVWPTVIVRMNVTIIYIFLISFALKIKQLEAYEK